MRRYFSRYHSQIRFVMATKALYLNEYRDAHFLLIENSSCHIKVEISMQVNYVCIRKKNRNHHPDAQFYEITSFHMQCL